MSGGRGYAGTAYYLRTDRGLWIRSVVDYSAGEITVEYQRRVVFESGVGIVLDEDGKEAGRFRPSGDSVPDEWVRCSALSLDGPYHQFCLSVSREIDCAISEVHLRTAMHVVRLSALGWGGSIGDPLGWFECGPVCAEGQYTVDSPGEELSGLEGAVVVVVPPEDGFDDPAECSMSTPDGDFDFELTQATVLMRLSPLI